MVNGTGGAPSISDSASQTWTAVGSVNTGTGLMETQMFVVPNSAALTSVTCSGAGSPSGVDISIYDIGGMATSSPIDATASNVSNSGNVSSLTTGSLTTTNANDILFDYTGIWSPESTVSPGSGFSIDSNSLKVTSSGHVGAALSYQIVSAVQSALTTSMSWTTVVVPAQANFASFKAGSGGASTGWSSSNMNVATVNGTGLTTANQGGTSTIQACVGATCDSTILTVQTSQTDTCLLINSASTCTNGSASGSVGSSVTFSAMGNITGNDFTASATWGSSNSSVASLQQGSTFICNAPGTATITATKGALSGTAVLTCSTVGAALLTGCVVNGASPSCATPSGWTLVRAEGFDSGTLGTGEWGRGGSITSAKGHTGNSSWTRLITGDGSDDSWGLTSSQVGSFNDIYMSSWTYVDPVAHIETGNFYFFRLAIYLNGGNSFNGEVDVNLDNFTFANNAVLVSITNPTVDIVTQAGSEQNFPTVDHAGDASYTWNLNLGTWQQNEWWFHDNTCTGSTANNDGFYRLYINGKLVLSQNNVNLTGCEQTSAGGWQAEVGGVDTVGIVENASGQCVGGEGTAIPSGGKQITVNPFSSAPALEADGVTPCMNQNNFNYYADDIIILKK